MTLNEFKFHLLLLGWKDVTKPTNQYADNFYLLKFIKNKVEIIIRFIDQQFERVFIFDLGGNFDSKEYLHFANAIKYVRKINEH